ncbi:helix-turn-helix transcriptional regulator [Mycetohabitans sp. B46]
MKGKEPATVLGQRLRKARHRANLPQDELGVQIGLDEGTASARMSRYETGIHAPPFGIVVKLAQALQIPTAYFYCEEDDLADLIASWALLTPAEREHIQSMIETMLAAKRDKV